MVVQAETRRRGLRGARSRRRDRKQVHRNGERVSPAPDLRSMSPARPIPCGPCTVWAVNPDTVYPRPCRSELEAKRHSPTAVAVSSRSVSRLGRLTLAHRSANDRASRLSMNACRSSGKRLFVIVHPTGLAGDTVMQVSSLGRASASDSEGSSTSSTGSCPHGQG